MKTKRLVISLILLNCLMCAALAQDFQGKAFYQTKTNVEVNLDDREIPEAMKQRIRERIKNRTEQSFELEFDRTTSVYTQEKKLEAPGTQSGVRMAFAGMGGGEYYKNIQNQTYANQTEMFGKMFLIKDSLNTWEWKLGAETKQIGNYTCYKATAIRQMDEEMVTRMRRVFDGNTDSSKEKTKDSTSQGNGNSILARIEEPENVEIIAWYAPEIPVSQGPGPYWGLPGLILEVNDGRTAILCSKLVLNSQEKLKIEAPSKGKEVTQEEYDRILAEKMEEMSERFRSGGRGNGARIMIRG
ncbi:GLPGLI family protein [Flagellimonas meridianipacifica]|uniref:GLPGLI family protein n=1 Tax=Flagellimonas meridianipacifica TaxID=1080225 RepID=A0A2T0MJR9_9FLAO|nr:GLPGLI family protein [Allomuricauda pacifica]PRX57821.1 GLPGLI family protein [Allomuricauda pacifica]